MVGLASDLNMQTTAEGVETQEELQLIRDVIALNKPFVFTIFGSPYLLTQVPECAAVLDKYRKGESPATVYPDAEKAKLSDTGK